MKFLLDTCVLAEWKKKRPSQRVLEWLNSQHEEALFISVLTIGEVRSGVSSLSTSKKKTELETWLETLILRFGARVVPIDISVAVRWGELTGQQRKKGRVLPVVDSLIAATALQKDMTLITRNEKDFVNTGVSLLNIWS